MFNRTSTKPQRPTSTTPKQQGGGSNVDYPTLAQIVETETAFLVDTVKAVEADLSGLDTDPMWLDPFGDGPTTLEEIIVEGMWLPPAFYALSRRLNELSRVAARLVGHAKTLVELRNVHTALQDPGPDTLAVVNESLDASRDLLRQVNERLDRQAAQRQGGDPGITSS